ncbi:MAG: MBL fold metallo-hydrolase [Euryarchaeota archaeon]|jgi:predicted metallo-beta-lactamase superfamily hydrolase|uniref:MBL fold metallo-hydrolase n=1 Tax=Methanobacterium sp. MZD130B TaxID=3394378 RepID=UPI0017595C3C|nr:MBL fold metallo-hydrolase [Euryarchaeota archaeon]HHT19438.1 MBL fold metallo-hydrolase [Methanobacterium sp.]
MKIVPLAFESMGVRSMATFIETDQKILIDPGTSIAPKRFGFPPWKDEFDALHTTRARVQKYAKKADILTLSHYHHDHFTPFSLGRYLDSSPRYAEEMCRGKKLFIKHPTENINKSQQKRARLFLKNLKVMGVMDIHYADGNSFQAGDTLLRFSEPLPHGKEGSHLGFVITTTIEWEGEKFMHASDVQGPLYEGAKKLILNENPDTLILSGPPIYLEGFALEKQDILLAKENLTEISQKIPRVIVDHHLLRDLRCFDFIKGVKDESKGEIMVASELLGKKPFLLEARRKEFYF